jgi:signal transduction histidine kinase
VDEFNKSGTLHAAITVSGIGRRLPRGTELTLYRVGQEALSNVSRHAHARRVNLDLQRCAGDVVLLVRDDGVGFHPQSVQPARGHGLGLVGMRERVATVGGALTVESQPGRGTIIEARIPLAATTPGVEAASGGTAG